MPKLAGREGQNPIPSIPEPSLDPASLKQAIMRLREAVEIMSGQRGPRDADLFQGLRTLTKTVTNEGTERRAEIRELNEVIVEGDTALASQYTTLSAEVTSARQGQPNLSANMTLLNQARIDGDVALATSVNTLSAEITNARSPESTLAAKITSVDQARVTGDSALASSVVNLSATVDDRTASGQVRFIASGSLWGMSATWSVYLQAEAYYAGISVGVDSGGLASVIFDCNRFLFNNSGTGQSILSYDGQFSFNGNVKIYGDLMVTGSINYLKMITNTISQVAYHESNSGAVVYLACRPGSKVLITAGLRSNGVFKNTTLGWTPSFTSIGVQANGVTIGALIQASVAIGQDGVGGLVYMGGATSTQFIWSSPGDAVYGFSIAGFDDEVTTSFISVMEITR